MLCVGTFLATRAFPGERNPEIRRVYGGCSASSRLYASRARVVFGGMFRTEQFSPAGNRSAPIAGSLLAVATFLSLFAAASAARAQDATLVGPELGAASNFSQGRQSGMLKYSSEVGVHSFRDGMSWERAEPDPGHYDFSHKRTGYPVILGAIGGRVSVVLNWGNPHYDNGDTPHSPEALRAFGAFAGALVERFPQIDSLEVGNEFNGVNFVSGPLRDLTPLDRARAYVPMLKAASRAARAERADIRILGGATHSLPAGYLWALLDAGAGEWLDSLAVHPYTTPAEQFVRQVAVLRRHPVAASLPLEVTEFGSPDPEAAAGHLLRNYCQFALGGVTRAVWYPLNTRGDGMVPLFAPDGEITSAGEAFRLVATYMEGRPVADAAPDAFGYGCRFGEDVLVLWGAPRDIQVPPDVLALDARGRPAASPLKLSETEPLVLIAPNGESLDGRVNIGDSGLIADSFHEFSYPENDEFRARGDGFERFARRGEQEFPLRAMPGQQARGTPWVPYRGNENFRSIRLTAQGILPGGRPGAPVEIVHRYVASSSGTVLLKADFRPGERSEDGISVGVTIDGVPVFHDVGKGRIAIAALPLELSRGSRLEIVVGPNGTSNGDLTDYTIRLRKP